MAAALEQFAQRGFYGTSIRDIGRSVPLQSASLYTHFPSKEHILAELVRIGHEAHHRRLRAALLDSAPDPAEQLRALARAHVLWHAQFPVLATVANNELHCLPPELAGPSVDLRWQSELLFVDIVERGAERGVFDPPHVWMAAAAILGAGIRVANWYEPGLGLSPEDVAETYAELAVRTIRPGNADRSNRAKQVAVPTEEILKKRGRRIGR